MRTIFSLLFLAVAAFADMKTNHVPSRLQWMANSGYCGETSLISAGLYYGQYLSQYDARAIATKDGTQTGGSLLLGLNDKKAAHKMHLSVEEWDTDSEQNTEQFLIWLKQKVAAGNPVAIGVYANQYLFYGTTDPSAGDPDYDHIVSVTTLASNHPITDPTYYGDDQVGFSDNGFWDNETTPVYYFSYTLDSFQADRKAANAPSGSVYSVSSDGSNYGIAITGVKDDNGDTLPTRVYVNQNYENPSIQDKTNNRPTPMPLVLTVTVSNLEPGTTYNLYYYNDLDSVPDSSFNASASKAFKAWPFKATDSTYTQTVSIQSKDTAVFRCVKASAP